MKDVSIRVLLNIMCNTALLGCHGRLENERIWWKMDYHWKWTNKKTINL